MRIKDIFLATIAVIAMTSCSSTTRSLTYFEDIKGIENGSISSTDYSIKIVPEDELLITVTSLVPSATAQFNLPLANPATQNAILQQTQPQQQTYIVGQNGEINFPVLGKLKVEGMTTSQLREMLEQRIGESVEDPVVRVQLVNFKVNVLGEVNAPGVKTASRERYTLLDALAAAGDLTEYGMRENVMLIREDGDQRIYHRFNLNNSETLSSPYFYLQQNDVIIVEPNEIRKDNSKYNQNNAYKLSVVSTIVSGCSIIASLVIALTVK